MQEIVKQGKTPIVVGGTGFYIQALLYDIDFSQTQKMQAYRTQLETIAKTQGAQALHARLAAVDAKSAQTIHPNNVKRVIRALEFYEETGTPISEHNEQQRKKESPYDFRYFVLTNERAVLYERIDQRVDAMLEQGLVQEVEKLRNMGYTRDMVSMQGLGYKEILDYLEGQTTLEQATAILKRDTRHFAKRQLTWFRRERDVIWLNKAQYPSNEELLREMMQYL
jgi:tRNA dimethylallyltransferase